MPLRKTTNKLFSRRVSSSNRLLPGQTRLDQYFTGPSNTSTPYSNSTILQLPLTTSLQFKRKTLGAVSIVPEAKRAKKENESRQWARTPAQLVGPSGNSTSTQPQLSTPPQSKRPRLEDPQEKIVKKENEGQWGGVFSDILDRKNNSAATRIPYTLKNDKGKAREVPTRSPTPNTCLKDVLIDLNAGELSEENDPQQWEKTFEDFVGSSSSSHPPPQLNNKPRFKLQIIDSEAKQSNKENMVYHDIGNFNYHTTSRVYCHNKPKGKSRTGLSTFPLSLLEDQTTEGFKKENDVQKWARVFENFATQQNKHRYISRIRVRDPKGRRKFSFPYDKRIDLPKGQGTGYNSYHPNVLENGKFDREVFNSLPEDLKTYISNESRHFLRNKKYEEDKKFWMDVRLKAWKERTRYKRRRFPIPNIKIEPKKRPVLQSMTTVEEIRAIIRVWIRDNLNSENLEELLRFLLEVIADKELEKVQLIIRYLQRITENLGDEWKQATYYITEKINDTVMELYDGSLLF
ncbi:hypothetical protein G9A89_020801 [Geosiphon pyriformis]|nr:hypothetical protein G9A89_020801 [Geosiphon pyriformis]